MSSLPAFAAPRSLLFVPADSERKLSRSVFCVADIIVLDLEDSVLPENKARAREGLGPFIERYEGAAALWVRINDLDSGLLLGDVAAAVAAGAAGVVLPKLRGPADLTRLGHYLDIAESVVGRAQGSVGILAVCTETAEAVLSLPQLLGREWPRLRGMLWGAEDLSSALGAGDPRTAEGGWRPLYQQARNQCLLICNALDIAAIDTVYVDFKDAAGCRESALMARHDGFSGKVAIHPDQVSIINAAYVPDAEELAQARRVVGAFKDGQGAAVLDGKMLDIPHLKAARRMLERIAE